MKTVLGILGLMFGGFVFVVFVLALNLLAGYNHVIGLDESVKNAYAQVENVEKRRYDLIPNLVETVKGVAKQEQDVFVEIARSRSAYFSATNPADKQVASGNIESALSRLLVFTENYPQLKSNEAFNKLMDSLEGTENRLTVERGRYNESVQNVNAYRRKFPGSFYASLAGVEEAHYLKANDAEKVNPKVNFTGESK